jgi:hypothetical protein
MVTELLVVWFGSGLELGKVERGVGCVDKRVANSASVSTWDKGAGSMV